MEKNKIFSKLNIRNYNNELEKILETKLFSSDVKNMLLSMLYKIENAYKDYTNVKREVILQKDFIEHILEIIKENCETIQFLNPDGDERPKIERNRRKIVCYPNEKSLLSCILYMQYSNIIIPTPYKYVDEAMKFVNNIGYNISAVETIRDFNGWSWDIIVSEIENFNCNILYQSLLLLEGNRIIEITTDGKERVLNLKNKNCSNDFLDLMYKISLEEEMLKDKEKEKQIIKIKEEKNSQFEIFKNKKEFVQKITDQKKKYTIQIEKIDKIINDTELLKKEYKERNSKLSNKEKIFSISYLADILEKEREEYLNKIKECNQILDPKLFVAEKYKLKAEVDFLSDVNVENRNTNDDKIICYCIEFLKCAEKIINSLEEKEDIIDWIYKIRYYSYIPFNNELYLKDMNRLQEQFEIVIKLLIKKAQTLKIWDNFTEDEELSYMVLKELFYSKIIDFQNVNMQCKYENGILIVEYYDGDILEMRKELKIENVRIKKKIKLFVK